jgi:predicted DNA-binding transcriptional regulator YafY
MPTGSDDHTPDEANTSPSTPTEKSAKTRTQRILALLLLLDAGEYPREEIYARLSEYYLPGAVNRDVADRKLERDLQFLTDFGFQISRSSGLDQIMRYRIIHGSGPTPPSFWSDEEVDLLLLLHNLFTNPETSIPHPHTGALELLPPSATSHMFAVDFLALLQKLVKALSAEQQNHFQERIKHPSIHLNLLTAVDYLPYRDQLEKIEQAIYRRQQIRFIYTSVRGGATLHKDVDPYYIFHLDGHFYLLGYRNETDTFLEYRIDRIIDLDMTENVIKVVQRRPVVEFRYWIDNEIARLGLSQRWLEQTPERIETFQEKDGEPRLRLLIRATAHNRWRVIQQLLKYGDRVEIIEPLDLRQQMRETIQHMLSFYEEKAP